MDWICIIHQFNDISVEDVEVPFSLRRPHRLGVIVRLAQRAAGGALFEAMGQQAGQGQRIHLRVSGWKIMKK